MNIIFTIIVICVAAIISILIVLNLIQYVKNKQYKKILDNIEIEKNVIDSAPIMSEISKIRSFLKNDKLDPSLEMWEERFKNIRNDNIPKITDMLLEAEYSLKQADYKSIIYKIAKLEMEIYRAKTFSNVLLNEIKEIASSEEKNRFIVTGFKVKYRELYDKYMENINQYGNIVESINLQFENIAKRFEVFELHMTNNDYQEVTNIIKSIDEMLKHMEIVIEEVPSIVLISQSILPKKIEEINKMYSNMKRAGYPLDFLNVDYNIDEANKKLTDINERAKILNLEDSLFELKILMEYFETLFLDFENESKDRRTYEDSNHIFKKKMDKLTLVINDIFRQIDSIKSEYNLSKDDIKLLQEIKNEIDTLNKDYEILLAHTGNNSFPFSKLIKEIENFTIKLGFIEEKMESSLDVLDNMKEDELRAREQLEEIKTILKESKVKMRNYNFPIIPKFYYTELNEAAEAIKEIVIELDKKPISINTLNTRVDTARDLVLKLFSRTNDMLKTAKCAEFAIVYGNRYRSSSDEIDKYLLQSEDLFFEGNYKKSFELSVEALNKIEPEIYKNILARCEK